MFKLRKLYNNQSRKMFARYRILLFQIKALKKTSKDKFLMDLQTIMNYNLILLKQPFSLKKSLEIFRGKKMSQMLLRK
jgi:hypothetical protein